MNQPQKNPQPWLLTPGPINTSMAVKQAMLHDWGSWDGDFRALTKAVCDQLISFVDDQDAFVCVPVQGSGTFAVEATLGTLIPRQGKALVLVNGAYGQRMTKILDYMARDYVVLDKGDYEPPRGGEVAAILEQDRGITHVLLVHCETSSGILNPVAEIAEVVERHGRGLIIDSMSAFGAIDIHSSRVRFDALISSANKCFEGVPGFGFALIRKTVLQHCATHAHSLSMDLYDQWQYLEKTGQWRFTPPTHVVAAFIQALKEHQEEGGVAGRFARYRRNQQRLVAGMRQLGFKTLLADEWLSPIIVTFFAPGYANFNFQRFYDLLKARNYIIYPGKLTQAESFRLGCIGQLFDGQIDGLLEAVSAVLDEMQITDGNPNP
ncbi:2-aminoethylphosphonate--pyruvate transaminase [Amphritea pacifica]|uniref:2-aminoethylphosphonate--pyruvate transaminase n=1 Tax=Amphritea pacifica TaxID=2811233 RepID=A0ABS2WAJ3_9GAMM|nr:2-aminoethylphosphonate--pyruvate transaminase [Amphritea pacifica]MBN0988741.1 2-aminoethylphosphonate--pyruvate transaminase [Amphritea pacifica]